MSQVLIHYTPAAHLEQSRIAELGKSVHGRKFGAGVKSIALSANTVMGREGHITQGALYEVKGQTPLRDVKSLMGNVLSGRVGVYHLKGDPPALTTVAKTSAYMTQNQVAENIDDYGEVYGPYSPDSPHTAPWTPQLENGNEKYNFAKLARHGRDTSKYAMFVSSNMTPQVTAAMDAALEKNPNITVREFAASDTYGRLRDASDLQNKRIAHRFAAQLGIADRLSVVDHPTLRTSTDQYAAPVQYAKADSMGRWGELQLGEGDTVRISNHVYDLDDCRGSELPVVRSPLHGVSLVSSTDRTQSQTRPLAVQNTQTASLAATPKVQSTASPLGDEEMDRLRHTLHWKNKDAASELQVSLTMGSIDTEFPLSNPATLNKLGHANLQINNFITLGAVVFP